MTESEWLGCTDPQKMLEFLRGKVSERKLRLFAVACCRRLFPLLDDKPISRKTLDFAERFADGLATIQQLRGRAWGKPGGAWPAVFHKSWDAAESSAEYGAGKVAQAAIAEDKETAGRWSAAFEQAYREEMSLSEAQATADAAVADRADWLAAREKARNEEKQAQAALLRCIFGPVVFRLISIDSSLLRWRDSTVVKIAQAIYEQRDFDRVAILADALQEAGCTDALLLGHLREEGHAKGCWGLDVILGKS